MAKRVFLHIGMPKTGTTYLQDIMWSQRDELAAQGFLLPGFRRQHLWAALDVCAHASLSRRHLDAPGSWKRLVASVMEYPGDAIVSHEFLCGASAAQASSAISDLAPAEVHLIISARDTLGMVTSGWQESIKNGDSWRMDDILTAAPQAGPEFGWATWDLSGVLSRWTPVLPSAQVHILPMPSRTAGPVEHWRNFAGVIGIDPGPFEAPEAPANVSLGVVQIELLRRLNPHLGPLRDTARRRGEYIRGYLAETLLAKQGGNRLAPSPSMVKECRTRASRAVSLIEKGKFDVRGAIENLEVPEHLDLHPSTAEVSEAELLEAAILLIADLADDVRLLRESGQAARASSGSRSRVRRRWWAR